MVSFYSFFVAAAMVAAVAASSVVLATADNGTAYDKDSFVTTWETTSAGESITIPVGGAAGTYTVNWGDGSVTTHEGDATHTYDSPGRYAVQVYGDFTRIYLGGDHANAAKLRSIDQWGTANWTTMESAFEGATGMIYRATDSPDLSSVTDMSEMFALATFFNGDISSWDVSQVTDMSGMFAQAAFFNGDISSWDVSQVTDMSGMFTLTAAFNQPLDSWDVSSVTDMSNMFFNTLSFNQPLDSWDVSQVTDMSFMFYHVVLFNQPLDSWDVSQVTDMSDMFTFSIAFDQPLDSWDVSSVTDMSRMFAIAPAFDQPLDSWDVSSVTDMSEMFSFAISFDQPLDSWDVSSVTDMSEMFSFAFAFDQPLDSWDVSQVTDMSEMFSFAISFDQNLGNWYIVPGDTEVAQGEAEVTTIAAQNAYLGGQNPTYTIAPGGDGDLFEVHGNVLRAVSAEYAKPSYDITILSTGGFGPPISRNITITVADYANTNTATVTGTVFSDTNGNGVKDEGEEGIEGHRMLATNYATLAVVDAYTAADGTYTFDGITPAPATTLVQTWHYPPGTTVVDPESSWFKHVTPEAGSTVTFDVGFYPVPPHEQVTLNITVYRDDNLNGVQDPGEEGIEGLEGLYVHTLITGSVANIVTDANGMATVTNLVPADFAVRIYQDPDRLADALAEAGYAWATTSYERDDGIAVDDPAVPVAANPAPGSTHIMRIGLAPTP